MALFGWVLLILLAYTLSCGGVCAILFKGDDTRPLYATSKGRLVAAAIALVLVLFWYWVMSLVSLHVYVN